MIKLEDLKPAYLFAGEDKFLAKQNLEMLKNIFKNESLESFELNFLKFTVGEDSFEKFMAALNTLPFLTEKRLILLEGIDSLSASQVDELSQYLDNPNQGCTLVGIGEKIKKNSKLFKIFKKQGKVIEVNPIRISELPAWVREEFSARGKKASYGAVNYLIENVGTDMQALSNELDKICLYHLKKDNLDIDDLRGLIVASAESSIFELVDMLGKRKKENAFTLLEKLINEDHEILRMLFLIVRQFRLLLKAKILLERDYLPRDIYRELKLPPFIADKYIKQSRNFSVHQLENAHIHLFEADYLLKSGRGDAQFILENLILKILNE